MLSEVDDLGGNTDTINENSQKRTLAPGANVRNLITIRPGRKNKPIAFVLSSARSGSTLLRVMLAGHSKLFVPPELHLLPYFSMHSRRDDLGASQLDQGLTRALAELLPGGVTEAQKLVNEWLDRDEPIQDIYRKLQDLAEDRLIVDKSPTYSGSLETLRRAEFLFNSPKYIMLSRHPYAVIESFTRNRLEKVLGVNEDPFDFAEFAWSSANANLLDFASELNDSSRVHWVKYEELVKEPGNVAMGICNFLEIPFEEALLNPYTGKRMTDGITETSLSIGDPNFGNHSRIDSALGDAWRDFRPPRPLDGFARRVATELFYELPMDRQLPNGVLKTNQLAKEVNAFKLPMTPVNKHVQQKSRSVDSQAMNIFLTGATGFVGIYLLSAILSITKGIVHCLVRADTPESGLARIKSRMEVKGLWRENYATRLRVHPGDLGSPNLGMDGDTFNTLSHTIDLIYHNAALFAIKKS